MFGWKFFLWIWMKNEKMCAHVWLRVWKRDMTVGMTCSFFCVIFFCLCVSFSLFFFSFLFFWLLLVFSFPSLGSIWFMGIEGEMDVMENWWFDDSPIYELVWFGLFSFVKDHGYVVTSFKEGLWYYEKFWVCLGNFGGKLPP